MMLSQRNAKFTYKNHFDYIHFKNIDHNFKSISKQS